jgi:hypothetical protein
MLYWECKCGGLKFWGSDCPSPCMYCKECGTNAYKEKPIDHDFMIRYDQLTGISYEICRRCMEKKEYMKSEFENYNITKDLPFTLRDGTILNEKKEDNLEETLGKRVREVWIMWAKEQPNPKDSWLTSWEELSEPDKEVDRRIGIALWGDFINELKKQTELLANQIIKEELHRKEKRGEK